jgi:hypothetical protein
MAAGDPRDNERFAKKARKKRDNYVYAKCALVTSVADVLETVLLKNKLADSDNPLQTLESQLESAEIQAEFDAMFHEEAGPHWSARPHWMIFVRLLKNTTKSVCVKQRKLRLIEEQEAKKRTKDLWNIAMDRTLRGKPSRFDSHAGNSRQVRFETNNNNNSDNDNDTENEQEQRQYARSTRSRVVDEASEYVREEGETTLRKEADPMANMMKTFSVGLEGMGATLAQATKKR